MASSKTVICQMALSHLGQTKLISNIETDTDVAARQCRTFFDDARRAALSEFDWSFAKKKAALSLIEEEPDDEWGYSYTYPSDCLVIRKIVEPGSRVETKDTRVNFVTAYGDTSEIILTDQEDAIAEYTVDVETISRFPPNFCLALSYLLASLIAPGIVAGDKNQLGDKAYAKFLAFGSKAEVIAANQEELGVLPESEFTRGR